MRVERLAARSSHVKYVCPKNAAFAKNFPIVYNYAWSSKIWMSRFIFGEFSQKGTVPELHNKLQPAQSTCSQLSQVAAKKATCSELRNLLPEVKLDIIKSKN